jgi:spermidine synthase
MAAVGALILASGAAGLIYELAWTRMLVLVFGNTLLANSTVVGAYLCGLAAGAYFLGRWADRRARNLLVWYAALELGIGVFGCAFPYLLAPLGGGYELLGRSLGTHPGWLGAIRFAGCFLLILVPTCLMGGTLPVLVKAVGGGGQPLGRRVGFFYGLNTLGAVVGCSLCGFWLLGWVGTRRSTLIAAGLNLTIAAVAWWLGGQRRRGPRRADRKRIEPGQARLEPVTLTVTITLVGIGISGFCSLAYEILWTRLLSLFFQNTVYSVTTILATFLLGIAVGSIVYTRWLAGVARKAWLFAGLEAAIGVTGFATPQLFAIHYRSWFSGSDWALILLKTSVLILIPTVLTGMTLPLATQIVARDPERDGETTGRAYAANTVGSVVGALVAGFVLIPGLGIQRSITLMAGLNLLAAALVLVTVAGRRPRAVAWATLVAVAASGYQTAPRDLFFRLYQSNFPQAEVKTYREGAVANVVVYDFWRDGYQDLYLNGVEEASSRIWHVQLFKLLGILPPLLHPHPSRALMIAFGAGISAGATASAVDRLTVVELNPDVQAVAAAFRRENLDVLGNPRVELIVNDGRNYLWLAPERYSVVISDATHPMSFDSWTLYSEEFYTLVKHRLAPGGVFAQWIPIPLTGDALRVILATFKHVFPHTSLWMVHGSSQCLMLATPERLKLDYQTLRAKLEPLLDRAGLRDYGIGDLDKLLGFFGLGEERIEQFLGGFARLSTDDLPHPQFYGGLDQAGVKTSLELTSYLQTAEPYLTHTGAEDERLHRELGRYLRIAQALDVGFLKAQSLEYEKAEVLAEGTRWQDDENVKNALGYDATRREYFARRSERQPRDHSAHYELGMVWLRERQYARAKQEFALALALKPDFAKASLGLARSDTDAGAYDRATQHWLALRSMNPTARFLEEAAEGLASVRALRKLRRRPREPALYRELGAFYAAHGRPIQALRAIDDGLGQTDFDPENLAMLTDLSRSLGLPEVALAAHQRALAVRSDDRRLAEELSRLEAEMGRPSPPVVVADPARDSPSEARFHQAIQQWNQQEYDGKVEPATLEKAASLLFALIRQDPKYMQAYAELSTIYEHLGRYREAAAVLGEGLRASPGFEAAEVHKERLELLDRLEHGLMPGEDRNGAYQRLGALYFRLEEFELSIQYLRQAWELDPKNAETLSHLGSCYLATGEAERALDALRRAGALDPHTGEIARRIAEVEGLVGTD